MVAAMDTLAGASSPPGRETRRLAHFGRFVTLETVMVAAYLCPEPVAGLHILGQLAPCGSRPSPGFLHGDLTQAAADHRANDRVDPVLAVSRAIAAWAGNTTGSYSACVFTSGHPRVGGEHTCGGETCWAALGSSPRGRGTRQIRGRAGSLGRVIPAWAGNT